MSKLLSKIDSPTDRDLLNRRRWSCRLEMKSRLIAPAGINPTSGLISSGQARLPKQSRCWLVWSEPVDKVSCNRPWGCHDWLQSSPDSSGQSFVSVRNVRVSWKRAKNKREWHLIVLCWQQIALKWLDLWVFECIISFKKNKWINIHSALLPFYYLTSGIWLVTGTMWLIQVEKCD